MSRQGVENLPGTVFRAELFLRREPGRSARVVDLTPPMRQDAQPACRDVQPEALPVFIYISGTTRHDPAPHMTWGNTA